MAGINMAINLSIDGGSPFRIKRPVITSSGFVSDVDETVKAHLDQLNALLGKRVFGTRAEGEANKTVAGLIALQITPKRAPDGWKEGSLLSSLSKLNDETEKLTLGDYIDLVPALSELKYAYENSLSSNWSLVDYNTRTALNDYPAIRDFLLVFAVKVMKVTEFNGLKNFVLNNSLGVKSIINYAIVSAARTYIFKQQLNVDDYNKDDSTIVSEIEDAQLSLSSAAFTPALKKLVDDFVFNGREATLIKEADIGVVPDEIKPQLIKLIKASPVPITKKNVNFFLPLFITQITGTPTTVDDGTDDTDVADKDFDVEYLQDDDALIQISRSAVKCAAQLFYGMVLGDELEVFDTINYFTHNYLLRGGIEIQDSQLRDDLQSYVFSNRFYDLRAKKLVDRTRPAEREMFYQQVFNAGGNIGDSDLGQVLVPNPEFPKLWKVLMLETAKYIERAQQSFYPDSYVSRQNVMQAVEDIQYNLSTHCIGMVNVASPMIYAELDFVIRRIFMHEEVRRQIAPAGATWWRVVETLYMAMRNQRPKATVLYNKAKLGHDIIRKIADYNPATFEDNDAFSAFVSDVEAFITTQSILQDTDTDDQTDGSDQEQQPPGVQPPMSYNRTPYPGAPYSGSPVNAGITPADQNGNGNGGGGEWDF
jgi:hypothetical protein